MLEELPGVVIEEEPLSLVLQPVGLRSVEDVVGQDQLDESES